MSSSMSIFSQPYLFLFKACKKIVMLAIWLISYYVPVSFGVSLSQAYVSLFSDMTSFSIKLSSLSALQDEADGSNEYNDFQPGSLNTTKQLIEDLMNIDIVFHIGDICYANGYLSQWDQFTSQIEPIASRVPYMIARFVLNSPRTS